MVETIGGDGEPKGFFSRKEMIEIIEFIQNLNYGFKLDKKASSVSFNVLKYFTFRKIKNISRLPFKIMEDGVKVYKLDITKLEGGSYEISYGRSTIYDVKQQKEVKSTFTLYRAHKINDLETMERIISKDEYLQSKLRDNVIDDLIK